MCSSTFTRSNDVPKANEVEVLPEGFVVEVVEEAEVVELSEPVDEPTTPDLANTCFGCKESFSVPLVMVLNQPYCGGCILKGASTTVRNGRAVLQSVFGRWRRKGKDNV